MTRVQPAKGFPNIEWSVSTRVFERGRVVELSLKIRNTTGEQIRYETGPFNGFTVYEANSCEQVRRWPRGPQFAIAYIVTIDPFSELVRTIPWYRETANGGHVLPGTYLVNAHYRIGRVDDHPSNDSRVITAPHRFDLPVAARSMSTDQMVDVGHDIGIGGRW